MEMTIRTTRYDVVSSGSVIVPYGEYLEFIIKNLVFKLSFVSNDSGDSFFRYELHEGANGSGTYMALECVNFERSLVRTVNEKQHLATIDGRPLLLQLTVSSVNKRNQGGEGTPEIEDKLVWYSWYLERPIETR